MYVHFFRAFRLEERKGMSLDILKMWEDGYKNIVNTDVRFSFPIVIKPGAESILFLNKTSVVFQSLSWKHETTSRRGTTRDGMYVFCLNRYKKFNGFEGYEMDVRDLKFDEESFDVAIDKGTPPLPIVFDEPFFINLTKGLWMLWWQLRAMYG